VSPDDPVLGRNDPCHCGSGKKYKQCHLAKDEATAREARAKAADEAPAPESAPAKAQPQGAARGKTQQPWKGSTKNTRGFPRFSSPRKVGGS
jgi:SEC-C motif